MQCPKCQGTVDDFRTSEGETLNFCRSCKGLWFDLEALVRYCQAEETMCEVISRLDTAHPTSFHCPRCTDTLLVEVMYQQGEGVLIDCCPACCGVWLDAGELPKVRQLTSNVAHQQHKDAEVDWQRLCGWIGAALLLVGMFLPLSDNWRIGSLSFFDGLAAIGGRLIGGMLAVILVAIPIVLTRQEQYRHLLTFGMGLLLWIGLPPVTYFLAERLEFWPPEVAKLFKIVPRFGIAVLLLGVGCFIAAGLPPRIINKLTSMFASRKAQRIALVRGDAERIAKRTPDAVTRSTMPSARRYIQRNVQRTSADGDWRSMAVPCPHCGRTLYNRKRRNCGFCNAVLPDNFILSQSHIEELEKTTAEINERHKARMKRIEDFIRDHLPTP